LGICKKCGRKFHYCGSCGFDEFSSNGYCSDACWLKSEEYGKNEIMVKEFYRSLDGLQRKAFRHILDEVDMDYSFGNIMDKWMDKIDKV